MSWTLFHKELRQIGPYEIRARLGKGSAGTVYQARHGQSGVVVAIKVLGTQDAGDPVSRQRFEQEFQATRTLDDAHLVRALDFGHHGHVPYLVMEYVEGESLSAHLKARGRLAEHEGICIAMQVAQALHHAHQRGMIHRDVKPGNILLATNGRTRLTDFGLVKWLEQGLNLTATATSLGTPSFMAPEQLDDAKRVDRRCDVYGLAASLYQAITGDVPFKASTYAATVRKKLNGNLVPPRQLVPGLSVRADWAILRALSVSPSMRQASCREFIRDLTGSDLLEVQAPAPRPAEPARERPPQERRGALRHACRLEGICAPLGDKTQKPWQAEVRDISVTGVALVLGRRFEPGTVLAMEWQPRTADRAGSLMARVRRLQAQESGRWLLGCQLAQPLGEDEMLALL